MSASKDMLARRVEASPWEQQCSLLNSHGGFSDSRNVRAALEAHGPRCGMPLATGEAKSRMTRRGVVYEYIRAHPGAHVRGIANELHLATGDLQYHLFWLE